jgi:hypothetical protein
MLGSKLNIEWGHCESATARAPIPLLYADIDTAYSCALVRFGRRCAGVRARPLESWKLLWIARSPTGGDLAACDQPKRGLNGCRCDSHCRAGAPLRAAGARGATCRYGLPTKVQRKGDRIKNSAIPSGDTAIPWEDDCNVGIALTAPDRHSVCAYRRPLWPGQSTQAAPGGCVSRTWRSMKVRRSFRTSSAA